jgi:uncharacterized cupredoxin-like copper-binding protein
MAAAVAATIIIDVIARIEFMQHRLTKLITALGAVAIGLALPASRAWAQAAPHSHPAGAHSHSHGPAVEADETDFGRPGNAKKISRTVNIVMSDAMRFTPAAIEVKKGETIRFVVRNDGKVKHEFVLGTMADLKEHAEAMKKNPEMEHAEEEDHAANLAPGKRGTVVWQFSKAGKFFFGCLVPGHLDAGMIGTVSVK